MGLLAMPTLAARLSSVHQEAIKSLRTPEKLAQVHSLDQLRQFAESARQSGDIGSLAFLLEAQERSLRTVHEEAEPFVRAGGRPLPPQAQTLTGAFDSKKALTPLQELNEGSNVFSEYVRPLGHKTRPPTALEKLDIEYRQKHKQQKPSFQMKADSPEFVPRSQEGLPQPETLAGLNEVSPEFVPSVGKKGGRFVRLAPLSAPPWRKKKN